MYIKFHDSQEIYKVTGERRQFWLFDKNGEQGRAVKGSDSFELIKDIDELTVVSTDSVFSDITVREDSDPEIYDENNPVLDDSEEEIGDEDA